MPGTKRKASFVTPGERPTKLAKRFTTDRVARSISSTTSSSDLPSPTPPGLRRAATLTVEEKETKSSESLTRKASSKKASSSAKVSLTKKASSVVVESGTVTTVVPLKSGSSVGETSLVSKESLKKAESLKKKLSKTPSVRSSSSTTDKEPVTAAAPLPPGGQLEVAISFDTTGSMYGVLEEVRSKVKDLAQRLQADIPGIRISVIAHGDYCDADKYIVKWIDFGASLPELCDFVEKVERTFGGDGPECYELVLKRAREELSWTPGSQRVLVVIGDDEPHPVGYTYNKKKYYIDWKEECDLLKQMGVKVYGVQSGHDTGATAFFSKMAEITLGHHVGLSDFSSIFDFLMMICYREGNPDMIPVYASEVQARHVGGMAKDMEALVKTFAGPKGSKVTPKLKAAKAGKPITSRATTKRTIAKKISKPAKTSKPGKMAKKAAKKTPKTVDKRKTKKSTPKTSIKKMKGKVVKKMSKKKKGVAKKKFLREKLNDVKFIIGPLKKLDWSEWNLAICNARPKGYSKMQFKRSRKFDTFNNQMLFGNNIKSPAVYEVGIKFPDVRRRKIYVMYFKASAGIFKGSLTNILHIVHTKAVQTAMEKLVLEKFRVYIRRGTGSKTEVMTAAKYLRGLDYAWGWHRKSGFRKTKLF